METQEIKLDKESIESQDLKQLVCFKLGDEEYAFYIVDIQEVIRVQSITWLPQMPDFVLGIINLRGNIVSVFDLRKRLSLPDKPFDEKTKIIVVRIDEHVFSVIVDEIIDNVTLDASQIDPAPVVKMNVSKDSVDGLGKLEGRMISILSLNKIHEDVLEELGC